VRVLVGINRRGTVTLRVPVEPAAQVAVTWNGDAAALRDAPAHGVVELASLVPRRGINTLEIGAPAGTVIGPIEILATPEAGAGMRP
jgi:hypothetical protein